MSGQVPVRGYRFGTFEADAETGELRRQGVRVKLNSQPFQMLLLLLERPGQLVTRKEIARRIWPEGTFVDYEHGVNSAVNRIREALGDTAANPRFVETLARRGYRFVAPVEALRQETSVEMPGEQQQFPMGETTAAVGTHAAPVQGFLASAEELPKVSHTVATVLFVLLQAMYLAFYAGALMNLNEIEELLSALPRAGEIYMTLLVTAAVLIPVRAFTLCAALFRAPGVTAKLLRLWPLLLVMDELWALAPFLLLHHINFGLALACTALLVYSPFAQRALALMGAGLPPREDAAAEQAG
jgi:DNA-binding winged helix-turn-helix (wHTH) protein